MSNFRSFTIRVPDELYLEIATAAQSDGVALNQKANQLLKLGLGKHISLQEAIARMLTNKVVEEPIHV